MLAVDAVKAELEPRVERLIDHLEATEESRGAAFFAQVHAALLAADDEADLIEIFLALSTTAFQGFQFDSLAALLVDEVLAYAEQVSHTFMASQDQSH